MVTESNALEYMFNRVLKRSLRQLKQIENRVSLFYGHRIDSIRKSDSF